MSRPRFPRNFGVLGLSCAIVSSCTHVDRSEKGAPSSAPSIAAPLTETPHAVTSGDAESATSASASRPKEPPPRLQQIPELSLAVAAQITDEGWVGAVRADATDSAITEPLTLVWAKWGETPERAKLPCSSEGLVASNLSLHRVVWADGKPLQRTLHVWQNQDLGGSVDGPFIGGAVGISQALITTGRPIRGSLLTPNGPLAVRYKNGGWSSVHLPEAAEKNWHDCQWDVGVGRRSDDFVLLQICAAPRRELAYAVYRLEADSSDPVRIPFDNALFDPVRAHRDAFDVEDDGTIDVGNDNPQKMTLARLRAGKDEWETINVKIPTRLASSLAAFGDHLVVATGDASPRESLDDGKTFRDVPTNASAAGTVTGCTAIGCVFLAYQNHQTSVWRWGR